MLIEVLTPLTVRLNQQEQLLTPGQPVDLPDDKALKLLQKAPGQVRIVSPYLGQVVAVENVTGQRVLTLIAAILQNDPRMTPGRWLGLAGGPLSRWVRDSVIKEWQPILFADPNISSTPANEEQLIKMIVNRPDYKNRAGL